ncbi:hypothetical protein RJ639_021879 [Escallonia herrerae]|uniref:S-protein homolog n=1 Tax=Escallonia herrerae TaxID=1293975 RepID=A0AA89AE84_9ASTE|nr:hypothetical protein RJ639_021879 [Escallonia herrerae]
MELYKFAKKTYKKEKFTMRRLALLIVVAFCLFFTTYAQVKAEVHVFNFLPGEIPLALHCQSKDDDIGYHTLAYGQELSWKFNPHYIIENTLFFCHFWWNSRDRSFTVYDEHRLDRKCRKYNTHSFGTCYWYVTEDGFYLARYYTDNRSEWKKINDW